MEQNRKQSKKPKLFSKKEIAVYSISFLLILVLTLFVNSVYINHRGGGAKIYALNIRKLTGLKRTEIHKEILRHPNTTTPKVIKSQINSFVKYINADSKKYEQNGVIIVKQAIIGGKGYENITGKIEESLKKQGVL